MARGRVGTTAPNAGQRGTVRSSRRPKATAVARKPSGKKFR